MMDRFSENKIILIIRKTRLDDLISRFNTEAQARFYIEHLGSDFSEYVDEDRKYKTAVKEAGNILSQLGRLQVLDRLYVPNFIFGREDIIVVLGQDGLVANVLKYLDNQPAVGLFLHKPGHIYHRLVDGMLGIQRVRQLQHFHPA